MKMRIEVLLPALAAGVMLLPSDGFAFDRVAGPKPAPCATRQVSPCAVALVEPYRLADGLVIPLPLPRPPGLGLPQREAGDAVCVRADDCPSRPN